MAFAAISKDIVQKILTDVSDFRAGLLNADSPHYDDKALTLFLLLRFRAGIDFQIHTCEAALCDMLRLSNRTENKQSIMLNLQRFEEDGLITMRRSDNGKFFWISLNPDAFVAKSDYALIDADEFNAVMNMYSRDKLLLLLYCIKKYQHKKTNISFVSIETIAQETQMSKSTITQGIQSLRSVLDIYQAIIVFENGKTKEVNYYAPAGSNVDLEEEVESLVRQHYKNVQYITKKEI